MSRRHPSPQDRYSDALAHLAASLQRLGLTMTGIEQLPPEVMHAVAAALDTVPGMPVHQPKPPRSNARP